MKLYQHRISHVEPRIRLSRMLGLPHGKPPIQSRGVSTVKLSTTSLAALLASIGAVIAGLIVCILILLIREVRNHKQLSADLEARRVVIERTQREVKRASLSKPRAVLSRHAILPFNSKSGWGTLSSVESINSPEPPSIPPHYVPPKPTDFVAKSKRLSWPFLARKASGRTIHMKKIRVPVLPTVIESPKPSPLVPVLSGTLENEVSSSSKSKSRPSSYQSLLQHHPAFRNDSVSVIHGENSKHEQLQRSLTAKPTPKPMLQARPHRSQSVTDILPKSRIISQIPQPNIHLKSASVYGKASGIPPDGGLPLLPLEIARIKDKSRRRTILARSPSRISNESSESVSSSILATQSSPIMESSKTVVHRVAKRDWKNTKIVGPRTHWNTLTLPGKSQASEGSMNSGVTHPSSIASPPKTPFRVGDRSFRLTNSSGLVSLGSVKTAESVIMSKTSSPACSPFTIRSSATPKRRSGSLITPYGSPEDRRKRASILPNVPGNNDVPKRQLSQASTQASSTRSSNGNPFQWDPAPMSAGKPSVLKGSPSARKGHRRQNCVRISLVPTTLGPSSRSPSPAIHDIQEESPNGSLEKEPNHSLESPKIGTLPRPPSTSTFAPALKFNTMNIQASLTASPPAICMADYENGLLGTPIVSKSRGIPKDLTHEEKDRASVGSLFSIPTFPSPGHKIPVPRVLTSPPPAFALSRPSGDHEDNRVFEEMFTESSSFQMGLNINKSPRQSSLIEEYDPECPQFVYQTPIKNFNKNYSSPFSTITEEQLVHSDHTAKAKDSPPCSPKTIFSYNSSPLDCGAYNATTASKEPFDTINPEILNIEDFNNLHSLFNARNDSTVYGAFKNGNLIPGSSTSALSDFQLPSNASFPIRHTVQNLSTTQTITPPQDVLVQRSPSSLYSSPSLPSSHLPSPPCSPRPAYAYLPTPTIDFVAMPTLTPSPLGPRRQPPDSLRISIQKLRRLNSDAKKGGREERRYVRLGREDSRTLPGDESWLDDLNKDGEDADYGDNESVLDEEEGRRLVGDLPLEYPGEITIMEPPTSDTGPNKPQNKLSVSLDIGEPNELLVTSIPRFSSPVQFAALNRSSSIWEDGEKFWASTPPHPPNSPNKPKQRYQSLSSSPVVTLKRDFEVAEDLVSVQEDQTEDENKGNPRNEEREESRIRHRVDRYKNRKRSVLGVSTPNVVKILVQPPSGGGTPGSLYDADGFLA